jgi:hypothetical protein
MSKTLIRTALVLFPALATASGAAAQDAEAPSQTPNLNTSALRRLSADELRRIARGFQISPVRLNLRGKNVAMVGLGSYIVNAQGGCNDCHTSPSFAEGGDPFLGQPKRVNAEAYLAGGMEFGPIVSRNLTPDENGRPAGLTYAQFRQVMRTGVDLKQLPPHVPSAAQDLLQVMPWPVYQDMIDGDLRAVYEFLRAVPSRPGFPRE